MLKDKLPKGKAKEKPSKEEPDGLTRVEMRRKLRGLGYSNADANRLIKAGMTREEIATAIIKTQQEAPKA